MEENKPKRKRKPVDWEAIEREFSRGLRSNQDLAREHGITEGSIRHMAKRHGWTKDLSAKVRLKAAELLRRQEYESYHGKASDGDKLEIQIAAEKQVEISKKHRDQIIKHTDLRDALLKELVHQAENSEDYEKLSELLSDGTSKDMDRLQEIFRKAMSLPGRVDTFKKLTDTTKILIGLEREAYGISDNANGNANQPAQQLSISERIASLPAKEKAAKVLGILGLIKAAAEMEAAKNGV